MSDWLVLGCIGALTDECELAWTLEEGGMLWQPPDLHQARVNTPNASRGTLSCLLTWACFRTEYRSTWKLGFCPNHSPGFLENLNPNAAHGLGHSRQMGCWREPVAQSPPKPWASLDLLGFHVAHVSQGRNSR